MRRLVLALALLAACTPGTIGGGTGGDDGDDPAGGPDGGAGGGGDGTGPGDAGSGEPTYQATVAAIPQPIRDEMIGVSWHEGLGCPSLDSLSLVTLTHWGFDGEVHQGEIVVSADVADDVAAAFGAMFDAGFPIERVVRVDAYGGSDDASMEANNTSAFNCRRVTGGTTLSQHSYGTAIDLNPVQNPYIRGTLVLPESGEPYTARSPAQTGMVVRPGPALDAFTAIGWKWGGDWDDPIDYQHFSLSGL